MIPVRERLLAPALTFLAGMLLVTACELDPDYEINNPQDIDLEVTVLEDGLTVPVGSTEKIKLGDLINSAGEGINDFIGTGDNDELILKYDGSVSLNDKIAELDLANMAVIDGVSFKESFSYHLGDFNPDNFSIEGQSMDMKVKFDGMDLLSVKPASTSTEADELSFKAGLDQYKDLLSNNKDLDLGTSIGTINHDEKVLDKAELDDAVALYPDPNQVINVPANLVPEVNIPESTVHVTVADVKLDDNVTAITNVKTSSNAKMNVRLTMKNVAFTEGDVTPDVNLDFNGLLNIKDVNNNKVNLKHMVLTKDNGWTLTESYDVLGLAQTSFNGSISLSSNVKVTGNITTANATTTKATVAAVSGDMILGIEVWFTDFKIDSADLAIKVDPFETQAGVSLGDVPETHLPKGIVDVKKIVMDETKPVNFKVSPKNLDKLKSKVLDYTFTFEFPSSFKVKDAVNGKLVFSGDLANGEVSKDIVLQEVYPTISDGKLSLDAEVKVTASLKPKNIVINSASLPQSASEDLAFTVLFSGELAVKDYQIVLDNYEEETDLNGVVELNADALGDFSGVRVKPAGNPAITINCEIPTIKGLSLTPGKSGLKISMPDFLIFDANAIDASLNFNAADNSITVKNIFPKKITLPIKELYLKPVTVGGKRVISGSYSAKGSVSVPGSEISQADLEELFGTDVGFAVNIPAITAETISLDENLSFDVNQKFNLLVKNIPEQLQQIDEILLDEVYVNLDAQFVGLPSSATTPFNVDLTVTLPDFLEPNVIPVNGKIVNGKLSATPVKLNKLYNIKPDENGEIKGSIAIEGKISASSASINISELQSDITATVEASIQNANGKIAVSKAVGVFSYEIEEETTMALDNMPEMIKTATIDLADPVLNIDIATNLGIPMTADLELVPIAGGVEQEAIVLNNVELPYSSVPTTTSTKSYSICKAASSAPAGRTFIQADLSQLLKKLPDSIKVKIKASVTPTAPAIIDTKAQYTLDLNYGIRVPLAFGKDFSFSTETELDLASAASVISMGDFTLSGKVLNDSPLNLTAALNILDANGNIIELKDLNQEPIKIQINGASTSNISIPLCTKDKSRVASKLKIKIDVSAIPDVPVKTTDCLQFLDLVASASGITINPSK